MKQDTQHNKVLQAPLGATIHWGEGQRGNILAVASLGQLEKGPSGTQVVQGSTPYRVQFMHKGTVLAWIREKNDGDFAWFLLTKVSGDDGAPLKTQAKRLNGKQSDHFTFKHGDGEYQAMDIGGVRATGIKGDVNESFVSLNADARYLLAWNSKTQAALLWTTPMNAGGTAKQVLYKGQRISDIEGFVTAVEA